MKVRPTQPLLRTSLSPGTVDASIIEGVLIRGQALEQRGQRQEARALYEGALHDGTAATAADMVQFHWLIARTFMEDGDLAAAEDSATAALAISRQTHDGAGEGRAINTLAAIQWSQGEHDEARQLYLQAHTSARATGDASLASLTASNLAVIATVHGDDSDAVRYHESALADARAAGLVDEIANSLINLGQLHTDMGRHAEADRALAEATEMCSAVGDLGRLMRIELHRARLRVRQGEQHAALASWKRARELAEQTGDSILDGDAEHIAGILSRLDGDVPGAEAHFLRAEEIAVERNDLALHGETVRELAELYRWNGRHREMLRRFIQAHGLFLRLGAQRELADVGRRTAALEADFIDVARKWAESIEEKDVHTQGHCVRVADLSSALWSRAGGGAGMSAFWFRIGALLHDVGKVVVPAEVLNKPRRLTDEEWMLVQRHPTVGVELLVDAGFPDDVLPIVQSHHERWDGMGYPFKLAGEEIPLAARVFCIADVYDALTSKRSYKQAFTPEEAIEIMRGDAGTQFDPALFEMFEGIVR